MITVSKEDYGNAVLEAERGGKRVISATLAHWLSVSPPSITMALRRLKKDGLAQAQKNGRIRLTAAGRQIARKLALRHHLLERMLSEIFGMEWHKVHDEAERLEHAVSPDFEAKLLSKLGPNGPCPHGNQTTPDKAASRKQRGLVVLREAETGSVYMIGSVYERIENYLSSWKNVESGPDPNSSSRAAIATRR